MSAAVPKYKAPRSPGQHQEEAGTASGTGPSQRASYTPASAIDEHGYGRQRGKANAQTGNVPSVVVGGSSERAPLPKMPGGDFKVGVDKNVSAIIGY